jgi:hypothetical protein
MSTGTVANNFGVGMKFNAEDNYVGGGSSNTAATIEAIWEDASSSSLDSKFIIKLQDDNTLQTRFTILNDGKVGIGITSPARLLHVNGVMRLTPSSQPSGSAGDIYFDSTTNILRVHDGMQWNDCW